MKVGILGWDHGVMGPDGPRGEYDPDGPALVEHGRRRGHDTTLFTLEEVSYVPGRQGMDVLLAGQPATSFDAIISRAKLYGDDWRDRVERLTMVSGVPGIRMFDPVDVWTTTYSKFLMLQRLARAGVPVAPCRSATTLGEVEAAFDEWQDVIIKPSYGYRSKGVERITDLTAQKAQIEDLLAGWGTMLCIPFYPTQYGEYRITVAGETVPLCLLKLPPLGQWRHRVSEGASYERIEPPSELRDIALRAARAMGITLASLDVLPTETGYVVLEINCIPGFLHMYGAETHRAILDGAYEWVERHSSPLQLRGDG